MNFRNRLDGTWLFKSKMATELSLQIGLCLTPGLVLEYCYADLKVKKDPVYVSK